MFTPLLASIVLTTIFIRKARMKLLTRMTSPLGNNSKGFTFVEVVVALVVLSAGIVLIYKSFFLCVDYLNNLTCRIYASHLIDTKIADITSSFENSPDWVIEAGPAVDLVEINNRSIPFRYNVEVSPVLNVDNLYKLDVDLSWA